jgi:hypothetical protein
MEKDYTMLGGSACCGHAIVTFTTYFTLPYSVGDILFVARKARHGEMERVCVKKIAFITDTDIPVYIDTFNSSWMEDDLLGYTEAQTVALAYLENQLIANNRNYC